MDDETPLPLPPALSSEPSIEYSVRKEGKSLVSAPILPFNRSSRSLFAACLSGDVNSVAVALEEITKNGFNGFRITDETIMLDGNGSSSSSSSIGRGSIEMESSGKGDSYYDGDVKSSGTCQSTHLPGIKEEEVEGEGTAGDTETEGDVEVEVEREEVALDLKGILDLPDSLEGLSTCLHLAAEKGLSVRLSVFLSVLLSVILSVTLTVSLLVHLSTVCHSICE